MLTALGLLLLFIVALLAIPVTLSFQVSWQQVFQGTLRLRWLFGLVRIPIRLPVKAKAKLPKKTRRKETTPRKKQNVKNFFQKKPLRRRLLRFLRDLWHAIGKHDLKLHVRIGLGDPADTGQLWAFIGPVAALAANTKETSIRFEPAFFDQTFEAETSGEIRIVPLYIIYLVLGLLLSAPVRRAIRQSHAVA